MRSFWLVVVTVFSGSAAYGAPHVHEWGDPGDHGLELASPTPAAEAPGVSPTLEPPTLALATHYSHWVGPYASHGAGGRFRVELGSWIGVEGTLEVLMTEEGGERRLDIPLGSQVYAFWEPLSAVRLRGALGLCAMFSMSKGSGINAAQADDILLGFRVSGGAEVGVTDRISIFADLGWQRYLGHWRKVSVWSDALDGALRPVDQLALAAGVLLWL